MILTITGKNVPEAYSESWWVARHHWREDVSRNGPVLTVPYPTILHIKKPTERVLFDPIRDANPFFHVMEFCWMMAGSNDAVWLSQFNKRMMEYSDGGILRGAYGWRWRNPEDQIGGVITGLRTDPGTRQAVLSMWMPEMDGPGAGSSDRPCNTHIYFRFINGALDMTVCNRSNDMVWGMLGANAVHMTLLHEMVASSCDMPIGDYRVFTNNLHVYPNIPKFKQLSEPGRCVDYYPQLRPFPLLQKDESYLDLREDCEKLLDGRYNFVTVWAEKVAWPMMNAYLDRDHRKRWLDQVMADDWSVACDQWYDRRSKDRGSDNEGVPSEAVSRKRHDTGGDSRGAYRWSDRDVPSDHEGDSE